MDTLQEAIAYIKSGQKKEGGELLIQLLKEQPNNDQAWLWLAIAVKGRDKKISCLNKALAINPDNTQARKLLGSLEEPAPPPADREEELPPAFGESEAASPQPEQEAPEPVGEPSAPPFTVDHDLEPAGEQPGESDSGGYQPPTYLDQPDTSTQAAAEEEQEKQPDPEDRPFGDLVRNWTRIFKMSEAFFQKEVRYANGGDTLLSVLVHTIVTVLFLMITLAVQFRSILSTLQTELGQVGQTPNLGGLFIGLLVGSVLFTPISFYMTAGLQFLGGRLFGGQGTFTEQAYLQAMIQVPVTVLGGLISLGAAAPAVSCILGPLGLALSIWALILNIRAIKVVHELSTGKVVLAIIVPPILLMFVFGCILVATGSVIGTIFQQIINQNMPVP